MSDQRNNRYTIFIGGVLVLIFFVLGLTIGQYTSVVNRYSGLSPNEAGSISFTGSLTQKVPEFVDKDEVDLDLFWEVWKSIEDEYYKQPVSDKELFYGAIKGMVGALGDPYTVFFNPEEAEEFNRELEGKFEGIGAEIAIKNDRLTIVAPLPDSPAEGAGLRPGDTVLAINEENTLGMLLEVAVTKIRGPKGTEVVLTVLSKGDTTPHDVPIIRGEIIIKTVTFEMIGSKGDIGYLDIFSFNEDTARDFKRITGDVLARNPRGIILDLRSNPGGFLDAAVSVASVWVEEGPIVVERFSDLSIYEYTASGNARFKDIETIVLINEGSASASEIVAGALRDYGKAVVVGEQSFGKGSVQDYSALGGGAALKVTIAEWLTPKGTSINDEGIIPDIVVELTTEDFNADQDPQLDKALELLE